MNTTQNNKLLDNFLQKEGNIISIRNFRGVEIDREHTSNSYHNDWNLLLEVVEKIEGLDNITVNVNKGGCFINIKGEIQFFSIIDLGDEFNILHAKTKIEATYNACIEFVKWWNKEVEYSAEG